MRAHHEQAIQRLVEHYRDDPRFPALIVGGSVAKGWASDNSDVDILLVASDEEYARRSEKQDFGYFSLDFVDYPDGYVDGKVINLAFLQDVADHGSEPARAAFLGAIVAYSRIPELAALVASLPVYPEHERAHKIRAFASHLAVLNWYLGEAEKRHDPYLLSWAANNMVLYGGRLILAHNRLLYPYHKWFMHQLRLAEDKPENLIALIETLLQKPGVENARAFYECIMAFQDWEVDLYHACVDFIRDSEWNWRDGRPPLADS